MLAMPFRHSTVMNGRVAHLKFVRIDSLDPLPVAMLAVVAVSVEDTRRAVDLEAVAALVDVEGLAVVTVAVEDTVVVDTVVLQLQHHSRAEPLHRLHPTHLPILLRLVGSAAKQSTFET